MPLLCAIQDTQQCVSAERHQRSRGEQHQHERGAHMRQPRHAGPLPSNVGELIGHLIALTKPARTLHPQLPLAKGCRRWILLCRYRHLEVLLIDAQGMAASHSLPPSHLTRSTASRLVSIRSPLIDSPALVALWRAGGRVVCYTGVVRLALLAQWCWCRAPCAVGGSALHDHPTISSPRSPRNVEDTLPSVCP